MTHEEFVESLKAEIDEMIEIHYAVNMSMPKVIILAAPGSMTHDRCLRAGRVKADQPFIGTVSQDVELTNFGGKVAKRAQQILEVDPDCTVYIVSVPGKKTLIAARDTVLRMTPEMHAQIEMEHEHIDVRTMEAQIASSVESHYRMTGRIPRVVMIAEPGTIAHGEALAVGAAKVEELYVAASDLWSDDGVIGQQIQRIIEADADATAFVIFQGDRWRVIAGGASIRFPPD